MYFLYALLFVALTPIAGYVFLQSARLVVRGMRHYYSWKWHYAEADRIRRAGNSLSIINPKWSGMPGSRTWLDAIDATEKSKGKLMTMKQASLST